MSNTAYKLIKIMRREVLRIATKPMYLFCMIIAPLLCYVFFATLMSNGLPTDLPADKDSGTLQQCGGSP